MLDVGHIVGGLILSLLVGFVAWALIRGLERLLGMRPGAEPRRRTRFLNRARYALPGVRALIWFATGLLILAVLLDTDSSTTALVAVFPLALGLGLALRDYFADAVAGVRLAVARPFQMGDRIAFGEVEGTVLALGLTHTRIRTDRGRELYLPNRHLVRQGFQTVKHIEKNVPVEISLPIPEGMVPAQAKEAAFRAAVISRFASPSRRPKVFLDADEALRLRVRAYAATTAMLEAYRSDVLEIWLERQGT